jgi:hypothetical protein
MVEELESPNSRSLSEQKLHEVSSISRINFPMSCLPSLKASPLHVIYNLNGVLLPHVSIGANIKELHLGLLFSSLN